MAAATRTRLLLVDPQVAARESLASALERGGELEVVAQAESLSEAGTMLDGVDVAISELRLPDGHAADLVVPLRAVNPAAHVLALSSGASHVGIARAIAGLVSRDRAGRGEDDVARRAIAGLTGRELEVMRLVAHGLDSQEIAKRLQISERTERNHVAHILSKLGVHSRLQALLVCLRSGAVELSERRQPA
jgi:DNA-binding NarL/FixJ family response regulator